MNKVDKKIISLTGRMEKLILESGVSKKKYQSLVINCEDKEELLQWLVELFENEFKELRKIKLLLRDEVWENYKLLGVTNLREQVMLKKSQSIIRSKFNNYCKKLIHEKKEKA